MVLGVEAIPVGVGEFQGVVDDAAGAVEFRAEAGRAVGLQL